MHYRRIVTAALVGLVGASSAASVAALEVAVRTASGEALADAVLLLDAVQAPPDAHAVMDQLDRRFQPRVLVIPPGTLVDFPNSDDVRHHVYSFSAANRFELRLFEGTEASPVPFAQPGVVVLGCNIHDQMIGYVLVDPRLAAVSDEQGLAQLDIAPGRHTLSWWHPSLGEGAPRSLGEVRLAAQSNPLNLPVAGMAAPEQKPLSPLQQRFRKAAGHAEH